jgi:hypothetical protein
MKHGGVDQVLNGAGVSSTRLNIRFKLMRQAPKRSGAKIQDVIEGFHGYTVVGHWLARLMAIRQMSP